MHKHLPVKSFPILLVLAFLTLQWSSTHIHLAQWHDHDGSGHRHVAVTHQHHDYHVDAVDVAEDLDIVHASHEHGGDVVELNHECTCSKTVAKLVATAAPPGPALAATEAGAGIVPVYSYNPTRGLPPFFRPILRAPPVSA